MTVHSFIRRSISAVLLFHCMTFPFVRAEQPSKAPSPRVGLAFIENAGQITDNEGRVRRDVRFTADAGGARLYFLSDRIGVVFTRAEESAGSECDGAHRKEGGIVGTGGIRRTYRMDLCFESANPDPRLIAEEQAPGISNYYYAHCPDGVLGVRRYRVLRYENLWDGIDAVFAEKDGQLKYEFIVRPGGNPAAIRLRYKGADALRLDSEGGLESETPFGIAHDAAPVSWQTGANGEPVPVASAFRIDGSTVSFSLGAYDRRHELTIDPWATYFGGTGSERGASVALDADGNIYLAGSSDASDFPVKHAEQNSNNGNWDVTVAKFTAAGSLLWATYYGGSANDIGHAIAVDRNGNADVAGRTYSGNFPAHNAQQGSMSGTGDAFLLQLNSSGVRQWATFIGGSGGEEGYGVAVDSAGNVFTCGRTYSTNFPTQNPYQASLAGGSYPDVFVAKYNPGGGLQWATYYGGTLDDYGWGMTVDRNGNAIVTGQTKSDDFPVAGAHQPTTGGGLADGFVVKFNGNGMRKWATYSGGGSFDEGSDVAADSSGNIAVAGVTRSSNFPVQNAHQNSLAGSSDQTIVKYDSTGGRLWATYCGGPGSGDEDYAAGIAFDSSGNVLVVGSTSSTGFPVLNPAQVGNNGSWDGTLVKYNPAGVLQWATYYGGKSWDYLKGVAGGAGGTIVVSGDAASTDLYVPGASQGFNAGEDDAILATFVQSGVMSVELISLTAEMAGADVVLRFRTASETRNAGFTVERRDGDSGLRWEGVGYVAGRGSTGAETSYEFMDRFPSGAWVPRTLWYRLKQIDFDGTWEYTPVVSVATGQVVSDLGLGIYPSPAGSEVTVSWRPQSGDVSEVHIYDMLGRLVRHTGSAPIPGTVSLRIDLRGLPAGTYQVRVRSGERTEARPLVITGR